MAVMNVQSTSDRKDANFLSVFTRELNWILGEGSHVLLEKMVLNLVILHTPFSAPRPPVRANWNARRYKEDSYSTVAENAHGYHVHIYMHKLYGYTKQYNLKCIYMAV